MRPDIKYDRLVEFVTRIATEASVYPHNPTGYGNTSQQLREAAEQVGRLENAAMALSVYINEAKQMVNHPGGYSYGTIKRAPKTNTLTVK